MDVTAEVFKLLLPSISVRFLQPLNQFTQLLGRAFANEGSKTTFVIEVKIPHHLGKTNPTRDVLSVS